MAHIVLEHATKRYRGGKVTAVEDLSIECRDREFLAILGPSGAGKTSTLKMIAGVEDFTEGRLLIDGADMTHEPSQRRNVSMVFESYALYPHLTVRENLAFPLKAPVRKSKLSREELNRTVERWAEIVGLDQLLDRKPSQLSGGQRQRVSLARALVRSPEPNVILMDEPIAHLDAKLRNSMRSELKRLHQQLGATIIYVTHDYVEAMGMADRIVVISGGRMMQQGTPGEVYEHPVNEFVASTVGEPPMNFLRGTLTAGEGAVRFQLREGLSLPLAIRPQRLGEVDLGIRPAEIQVSRQRPEEEGLFGRVERILPTGAKQIMEINVARHMVLVKVPRDHSYRQGETVYLTPAQEKICLFDPEEKTSIGWEKEASARG